MNFIFRTVPQRLLLPLLFLGVAVAHPCEGGLVGFEETGSMAQPRAAHTATLLANGKVLVTGGAAQLYDPASRSWTSTGSFVQSIPEPTRSS